MPSMFEVSQVHLVKGQKKSTGLEGQQLDKIIIRDSFHHFKKKSKMLASIKKSLKDTGELFVVESVIIQNNGGKNCPMAMHASDIIKTIESGGFKLEQNVGLYLGRVLLKFVRSN